MDQVTPCCYLLARFNPYRGSSLATLALLETFEDWIGAWAHLSSVGADCERLRPPQLPHDGAVAPPVRALPQESRDSGVRSAEGQIGRQGLQYPHRIQISACSTARGKLSYIIKYRPS